jgi:hypothetical protein
MAHALKCGNARLLKRVLREHAETTRITILKALSARESDDMRPRSLSNPAMNKAPRVRGPRQGRALS